MDQIPLLRGEQVKWSGRPRGGWRFRPQDVFQSAFGLLFTAVSLVLVTKWFPLGLLVPHFWFGLYFLILRYPIDAAIRSSTTYTLTDSRAIIQRTFPRRQLRTVNLAALPGCQLVQHRDGSGTIELGDGVGGPFNNGRRRSGPSFDYIDNPVEVWQLVHDLARRPPPPETAEQLL